MKPGLDKNQILEVELELTGTCNLECPLCIRSYEGAQHFVKKHSRPLSEWISQLDQYTNLKLVHLAGSISEPTMYKDFIPLVKYLVDRKIEIQLYTNGNTHKPEWWAELGKLLQSTDSIFFCICGSNQELHEKYRVGSDLQEILNHADALRSAGKKNDFIHIIRFEYNKDDIESDAMKLIINQFSKKIIINSKPYQERFGIIKDTSTPIKMVGELGKKYNTIKHSVLNRYENKSPCTMKCKSYETKFLAIDNFGKEFPCFLYRMREGLPFDHTDYTKIHNFEYDFCFECEYLSAYMIKENGMETLA